MFYEVVRPYFSGNLNVLRTLAGDLFFYERSKYYSQPNSLRLDTGIIIDYNPIQTGIMVILAKINQPHTWPLFVKPKANKPPRFGLGSSILACGGVATPNIAA
jgi:hypothetical protein